MILMIMIILMIMMILMIMIILMIIMIIMMLAMYDITQDNGALAEPWVRQYSQGIQAWHTGYCQCHFSPSFVKLSSNNHQIITKLSSNNHQIITKLSSTDIFSDDDWIKGSSFNPQLGVQIHALQKGIYHDIISYHLYMQKGIMFDSMGSWIL